VELATARKLFGALPVVSVATVSPGGSPHVVPLWFVWLEDALYVSTRREGRTWRNVQADPRVSVTIDVGRSWNEIAGVVLEGPAEPLLAEHPSMRDPISAWHEKYRPLLSGEGFERFAEEIRGLAFLRLVPERVASWDHARG
jgi:nitroimidazol reductase NimA-like FMN-containing flavoprotein (pyridoxamine 5'-phosphate oxidase superfamily)